MNLLVAAILLCAPQETEDTRLEWMADLVPAGVTPLGPTVGGRYRYWFTTLEGMLQADDDNIPGTNIDLVRILNLDDAENINGVSAWVGLAGGRIWVDWWEGTWEGDNRLSNDVTFAGQTFTVGTDVHSKIVWRTVTGLFLIDLPTMPDIGVTQVHLSVGGGLKYLRIYGRVEDPTIRESGTFRAPVPVLGGSARVTFGDFLAGELEVNGLHIESWKNLVSGTIYDIALSAQATYNAFFAGVGYRWFGIRVEDERTNVDKLGADLQIRGFFLEGGVRF